MSTVIKLVVVAVLVVLVAGAGWFGWSYYHANNQGVSFRTEKSTKGKLTATISSTGTIEPEEVIDVGAQIAGRIERFGPDLEDSLKKSTVDFRTTVNPGDVLAVLDDSLYQAKVDEANASLASADADLTSKQASRAQAEREWTRAQRLKQTGTITETDFDTAHANFDTTSALVRVAESAVGLAKAQLKEAKVNLGYTVITSPVKGVIIDRRVNVGQTVVAGLSAPSLFLLAKDLTRMQVWVSVNEADIGSIKKGQKVLFTVDTFPGIEFEGSVNKVRYNAIMTQNVVTYTVEVATKNEDLKLLPYMTANVRFFVDERQDAKLVPNAALRWRPSLAHVHPDFRTAYEQSLKRRASAAEGEGSQKERQNRGTVWVEKDGFARPVKVQTGLTDNINTEILQVLDDDKDVLNFDTPVIVGENQSNAAVGSTVNPFVTPIFKKKTDK